MSATTMPASRPARVSVWQAFTQPAAWTMCFFGFSSGLPFLLVGSTLAYWLKADHIVLRDITMIASAGMTYVFKFLWAPLLDHWRLPAFARFGRRRGWLLLAQLGVVAGLLAMAALTPSQLDAFIVATLAVAFFGATQDIAVDAYRIEIAPMEQQGALVATYSLGYRLGWLVSGAVALVVADHFAWTWVYVAMAAAMSIPIVANLLAREPRIHRIAPPSWRDAMRNAVADPFADFFRRYGAKLALLTLLFVLLFKIPEQAIVGGIMSPFYRDMGFTLTQIAAVIKVYGIAIGIAGAFVGGAAVMRFGIKPTLLVAIIACGCSNLLYLWLMGNHGNVAVLTAVISGENFTLGVLGPPTVAFFSSLVNKQHTATQYSLLSSMVNLPGKLMGFFAGGIVMATGYGFYFVLTVLAVAPAVVLMLWLWSRLRDDDGEPAE